MINNQFYDDLGDNWYTAYDHPIALLRAENKVRSPWVAQELNKRWKTPISFLDIGCGAGFLTNDLAKLGHQVTGIDISHKSLEVAKQHDEGKRVNYLHGNAYHLPFNNASFDAVSAMDILEHVENPKNLIQEAARVLKPKGLFFFHTFNRNPLSYLIVIKGVEWFVENTPPNMHVYNLFIKPKELQILCEKENLKIISCLGFMPKVFSNSFWKLLWQKKVPQDFTFTFTSSLLMGYVGIASKN